jgi:hypothetical protein
VMSLYPFCAPPDSTKYISAVILPNINLVQCLYILFVPGGVCSEVRERVSETGQGRTGRVYNGVLKIQG